MSQAAAPLAFKVFGRLSLAVIFVGVSGVAAWAQTPRYVRVVNRSDIVRWFPSVPRDVLVTVGPGTELEVLDRQDDWYWVVPPRDAFGARKVGWIPVRDVETILELAVNAPAAAPPIAAAPPPEALPPVTPAAPPVQASAQPRPAVRTDSAPRAEVPPERSYQFDALLFGLDRASIEPASAATLAVAARALRDDGLLRLKIEGYTCNLGTAAYNLALGQRRADAARDYLVSLGITPDRLTTVSFGEERPAYDNAQEETRRLNRRVVLVPQPANATIVQ